MNEKINQLSQELYQLLQSTDLPVGVVFLIIKDIYRDIESVYHDYLINKSQEELLQAISQQTSDTIEPIQLNNE